MKAVKQPSDITHQLKQTISLALVNLLLAPKFEYNFDEVIMIEFVLSCRKLLQHVLSFFFVVKARELNAFTFGKLDKAVLVMQLIYAYIIVYSFSQIMSNGKRFSECEPFNSFFAKCTLNKFSAVIEHLKKKESLLCKEVI